MILHARRWITALAIGALIVATWSRSDAATNIGSLQVEKIGSGSPAVILLPCSACGPWEWKAQIGDLSRAHAVYAVTIDGFDGVPPPADEKPGRMLDSIDRSLDELIRVEHIARPVLVGHEFGGFVAIRFAEDHSRELAGVIAVDAYPVIPSLAHVSPKVRARQSISQEDLNPMSSGGFLNFERSTFDKSMTDQDAASRFAALAARSDVKTLADVSTEWEDADVRPGLASIAVPLLEIVPVPRPNDMPPLYLCGFDSDQAAADPSYPATVARRLFPGAKTLTIETVADSRDFAMLDQPTAFERDLDAFIDSAP